MLVVLSPAKSLNLDPVSIEPSVPEFAADAARLARTARNLTLGQLRDLMDISEDLARLNRDRFRAFADAPAPDRVKPAALAFDGDTYQGLEARTLDQDDLLWAQDHLRILSGLYGLLRPLDAIQPYRLEMGSRLKTRRGSSLYAYWGDQIARALMAQAAALGTDTLVNCASQEYFAAVARKPLRLRVITPQFLELQEGQPRIISFFAKRARGAMARFIITGRLTEAAGILSFRAGGYAHDPDLSEPDRPAFVRPYQGPAVRIS
jgi:cytoplasmic iron level regulating protein YaaA (DUF328/UPF0246 family)